MGLTFVSYPRTRESISEKKLQELGENLMIDGSSSFECILERISTDYFVILDPNARIEFSSETFSELIRILEKSQAAIVYSDYISQGKTVRLNDYLFGSVRDDFDFGGLILFSTEKVKKVLSRYGNLNYRKYGALYDLRLKLSIHYPIIRYEGALYKMERDDHKPEYETIFSYVDPKNLEYQKEMEYIFTSYLKELGAYIPYYVLKSTEQSEDTPDFLASVVIPVKNREKTIIDALLSAVSQKTDFPYNIIVVDNHSHDKTGEIVERFSKEYQNILRIVPLRKDLSVGGCWNEAINHPMCGRYAIQLDSDDLYENQNALQLVVDTFRELRCAMVVGTYRVVNEKLEEIPPGIVDHREWTFENGHNNILRVSGLGAPRAFDTSVVRRIGFKDIGYGEDYAMGLRVSREFRVGRIRDCIYLARRWSDNTDSNLTPEKMRTFNEIKDRMRTEELRDRIAFVKSLNLDR